MKVDAISHLDGTVYKKVFALYFNVLLLFRRVFLVCALALTVLCVGSVSASAQEPDIFGDEQGGGSEDVEEVGDEPRAQEVEPLSNAEASQRMRAYVSTNKSQITIHQIVSEMVDDFTADVKDLNLAVVSPMAIRGVAVTPNLSAAFGDWVHSQMVNNIARHAKIKIKRCISCAALTTKLDGDEWVVQMGHVTQDELAEEARKLGVIAYLDAYVSFDPGANSVSLSVQIYRASDSKILWTETYMSDSTTAAILRSGDRLQTREEAYAELVRKIEQKPYYGYQLTLGMGFIPYDSATSPMLSGIMVGGRIYEKFGEDKRLLYGLHGESFLNFGANAIAGAFVGALAQYQINEPNLNDPIYRVGGLVEGFIAGQEGNSVAIEANAEAIFQFRLGASLGLMYFRPVTFAGADLGGFGGKVRFLFNW